MPSRLLSAFLSAAVLTFVCFTVCAEDAPSTPTAVNGITAEQLGGHLRFISSDLMEGRDTASPAIRIVSEYLAAHLLGLGAEPAGETEGDGRSYFQLFPLQTTKALEEGTSLAITVADSGGTRSVSFNANQGFMLSARGLSPGEISAPVVFAGHGIVSEREGIDAYEGLDVQGRIVLVIDGTADEGGGRAAAAASRTKRNSASKRGALALLVVHPFLEESRPYLETQVWARRSFGRESLSLGSGSSQIPVIYLEDPAREFIAAASGLANPDRSRGPLDGVTVTFRFAAEETVKHGRNVLGMFPGADPARAKEVVVFSAHYDHIGVSGNGEINNGADDNGSGTSALLEIAQAVSESPRPARSILFLWVSGEEKGLLGSQWFADHMTLPEGCTVVADINMDMVGRNDSGKIGVTPSSRHKDYSTLTLFAEEACQAEGLEATSDADQFYARTDSYNFAKKGIPVVFFFSGVHEDYHKPTDTFEKIDLQKAARVARAAYRVGWRVAEQDGLPQRISEAEVEAPPSRAKIVVF